MPRSLLMLSVILACTPLSADDAVLDLPHRRGSIVLDGRLDDWRGPRLEIRLVEDDLPPPLANTGVFLLAWDRTHLWLAAAIEDAEVFPPPAQEAGAGLYQWDSVELYIDGRGDRSERMGSDDFQIIVACDGRHAVLQGEPLLHGVDDWLVTKREQPGPGIRTAARRTATGYAIEAALPLAGVGVAEAACGALLALDVAWNDWIEDHPRLPELRWDLENLVLLADPRTSDAAAIVDPDSVGWDGLLAWETRAYRPLSLCNGPDFGHPGTWRPARLTGGPSLGERLVERWGVPRLFGASFLLVLGMAVLADLGLRRRYRRRIGALAARIEELSGRPGPADAGPPDLLADAPPVPEAPTDTAARLLAHVRDRLADPLAVAEAAAALGVSVRTLQRECRQVLGASPREVILTVKMRAARDMLASGGWRVGEVAQRVGFDSPYHFSRRFKDFHGLPPSAVVPPSGGTTAADRSGGAV